MIGVMYDRNNIKDSTAQQRRARKIQQTVLTRLILISHRLSLLSLLFSSRSESCLYNTKQKKVQSYAQATLNVQHQATHTLRFFFRRGHHAVQNPKQTKDGRDALV